MVLGGKGLRLGGLEPDLEVLTASGMKSMTDYKAFTGEDGKNLVPVGPEAPEECSVGRRARPVA